MTTCPVCGQLRGPCPRCGQVRHYVSKAVYEPCYRTHGTVFHCPCWHEVAA